jgi:L-ribulose-5-phosphate 4-epimerase
VTLKHLKDDVCAANLDLVTKGLVTQTWGNASGVDRSRNLMVIKPSGVSYEKLRPADMVVISVISGEVIEGRLRPSSDTQTHLALYRAFKQVAGIVHTHSTAATAWAQTCKPLPALGTTHADYFHGPVPCTRLMKPREIETDYELNTGRLIVKTFAGRDPMSCPAVLVASHGPFTWGKTVGEAVHHAEVLEHLVKLAAETLRICPSTKPMQRVLLDQHFFRKHGALASYGQRAYPMKTKSQH